MRILEIKSIIKKITNQDKKIEVFHESLYGGSVYKINNLKYYIDFLKIISEFNFSDVKKEELEEISFFKEIPENNILGLNDFNLLVSLINRLNTTISVFFSIIDTLAKDQDPYILNIKIPEKFNKLSEFSSFNTKLKDIFKKFDYGNDEDNFLLVGFDKGSEWYEILLKPELFNYVVFALDTVSRYLGWWEVFKFSKDFILSKNIFEQKNDKNDNYENLLKEQWLKNYVTDNLEKIVDKNGREDSEIIMKIILGAKDLILLIQEGAELRISYNPPEYINQDKNFFEIDYAKLSLLNNNKKKIEEKEKLESPKSNK